MILPEKYTALGRSLGRSLSPLFGHGDEIIDSPDPGYVFVYTPEDLQLYDHFNRAVQVPETFANS